MKTYLPTNPVLRSCCILAACFTALGVCQRTGFFSTPGPKLVTGFEPLISSYITFAQEKWSNDAYRQSVLDDVKSRTQREVDPLFRYEDSSLNAEILDTAHVFEIPPGWPRISGFSVPASWEGEYGPTLHRKMTIATGILLMILNQPGFTTFATPGLESADTVEFYQDEGVLKKTEHPPIRPLAAMAEGLVSILYAYSILLSKRIPETSSEYLFDLITQHEKGKIGLVNTFSINLKVGTLAKLAQTGGVYAAPVVIRNHRAQLRPDLSNQFKEARQTFRKSNPSGLQGVFFGYGCPFAWSLDGEKPQLQRLIELFARIFHDLPDDV